MHIALRLEWWRADGEFQLAALVGVGQRLLDISFIFNAKLKGLYLASGTYRQHFLPIELP